MTRRSCIITAGSLTVVAVLVLLILKGDSDAYKRSQDISGFHTLGSLAARMIEEGDKGTVQLGNQRYIVSFEAFFDYVHKKMPAVTSNPTARNPFPGLLSYDYYGRLTTQATNEATLLLWTSKVEHSGSPLGDVQHTLTCGGLVKQRPDSAGGVRFGPIEEN